MDGQELDIAKNIQALDWVKAELVNALAKLFKSMIKGDKESMANSLSRLIICCFLTGKRFGLSFGELEDQIYLKADSCIKEGHPFEEWFGELTALKTYLDMKR